MTNGRVQLGETMSTDVCPNCANTTPLQPRLKGESVKCNVCGRVFTATAPVASDDDVRLDSRVPDAIRDTSDPRTLPSFILESPTATSRLVNSSNQQAQPVFERSARSGALLFVAVAAVFGANWWSSSCGARHSSTPKSQVAPSYPIDQTVARSSGQARYSELDALMEISAERSRYAAKQKSALAADSSRKEVSRKVESDQNTLHLSKIRREIVSLKQKLELSRIVKPLEPIILDDNAGSLQSVLAYVDEYRSWGEKRLALRRELFSLQDEEAALVANDLHTSFSSPHSDLSLQIALHSSSRPTRLDLSGIGDRDGMKLQRTIHAVQLEQWRAELELFNERLDQLSEVSTAQISRSASPMSKLTDVASGPWRFERCVDGDTIEISIGFGGSKEMVRLLNINTPEAGQTGYDEATSALKQLLEYRSIELEFEEPGQPTRDRYGRILAFVFVGGKLANYEMVKQGWTYFYTDYGRGRYAVPIEFAEADAKAHRRGLHR